jgi:hypothetical protein
MRADGGQKEAQKKRVEFMNGEKASSKCFFGEIIATKCL